MQKSMLVDIMRSLQKKEVRELQKWLQSPTHNQRQDVVQLFDYLCKNATNGDKNLEKERAWKTIFPGKPYEDAFMRQVMYFLQKAIEEYLVFADYAEDKVQFLTRLTKIYRIRKLDKAFKQSMRLGREALKSQPLRNSYYLLHSFLLENEEYEYLMTIDQNASVNLQESADAFEKWFYEGRLRISRDMLALRTINQKINYEHGLLDQVLEKVKLNNLLEEPAIAVYYYTYMAATNRSDETYFDKLEDLIHNQMSIFDHSELRTLYLAALNYCVVKINQGRQDYARRAFELYRRGMESGILIVNGMVSRYTFGNAVGAAIKIGEYVWAEKFIQDFQHHLDERLRNSIVNFNLSRVYFEKRDYSRAQSLLAQFEYDDITLNFIAKTMLLKIYFEMSELDAFESLLESLRIYLQRKEALYPELKQAYKNMISLMKKLLHHNPHSKTQRDRLRGLVESTNPLIERDWLLRQL